MPQFSQPKIPAIYDKVQNWFESGGGVKYIAWAITAGPTATPLGNVLAELQAAFNAHTD
jgi:hypothetical protein